MHILAAVRAVAGPSSVAVSASIGYALAPADALDPMKILQRADDAMYAAKRLGKNCVLHCAQVPQLASS